MGKEISAKKMTSAGPKSYGWILQSTWVLTHALFWVPVIGLPALSLVLLAPFLGLTRVQRLVWRCAAIYFKITLWATGAAYTVIGLENLDPDKHYFFACNHESIYDIPLVFAALPFWLIAISKSAVAYFPIFGWAVACGGTIFIDRSDHNKAVQSLDKGRKALQARPRSVLLFPEGTRSSDGSVRPFKKGGLVLAIQAKMPVVPVAICNTRSILGAKIDSFKEVHKSPIMLIIGKPVETVNMAYEDRDKLSVDLQTEVVRMKKLWEQGVGKKYWNHETQSFWGCWVPTPPFPAPFWGRVLDGYKDFQL
mmetsp:Transcript_27455/g.62242  ORF Transcript_27455/g.62242 Transcript_27455/m.62242 type:complete len:308 (-) Transcript_27455:244-1167(-)